MVANSHFQDQTETHQTEYTALGNNDDVTVSNLDSTQRKAFQSRGSLRVFIANFVTAKWSVKSDVNVPDTRTRKLRRASHCQKSLQSTQPFCIVTHESGSFLFFFFVNDKCVNSQLKVLRSH